MKPTAEDLKLVAEQFYQKDKITTTPDGCFIRFYDKIQKRWDWLQFRPTEDAERCDKIQDKFKVCTIWREDMNQWEASVRETQGTFIYNDDRKTAVFLAAVEYIKNKK